MFPQIVFTRGCKITLVAFVWLLSTMRFHMVPQRTYLSGCKVAPTEYVRLFPTVHFQMCSQTPGMKCSKLALTASVWLFTSVFLSNSLHERMNNYTGCIWVPFHHDGFVHVLSNYLYGWMNNCIGCICLTWCPCFSSLQEVSHSHRFYSDHYPSQPPCFCLAEG